jgi:hypothetical protein
MKAAAIVENSQPKPLPASVQGASGTTAKDAKAESKDKKPKSEPKDKDTKTDPDVVQTGCASCGGGLLGGPAPGYENVGCTCGGPACVPGRLHCCSACCSDTCCGKILCGLYECICCPDPCYEPHWVAPANAAFFVDPARPRTQMMLRYDGMADVQHPDRAEYFIPRSSASNSINNIANKANPTCLKTGFGKGPKCIAGQADIEDLSYYVEGAVDKVGVFIQMPYREFGPSADAANAVIGGVCCNQSGFGDLIIGSKTLWLDCELLQIAFQFKTFLPTGNFLQNLGTAHVSLEPSLLFALKLTPDTYLQAQTAYWIAVGGDALYEGNVFHAHLSLNQVLYRILPDVQLIGTLEANEWSVIGGNYTSLLLVNTANPPVPLPSNLAPLPVSATADMFSVGPGIRLNICDRIDFGVGSAFSCTGARWAKEEVRAEFRWRF